MNYLWVALGGAMGSVLRFWLGGLIEERLGPTFPWGTLVVNVTGSFVIGFFAMISEPGGRLFVAPGVRVFVMIGLCGGYTTFSSFSLQTLKLAQSGEWTLAAGNIAISVILCLIGVWLGFAAGSALNRL